MRYTDRYTRPFLSRRCARSQVFSPLLVVEELFAVVMDKLNSMGRRYIPDPKYGASRVAKTRVGILLQGQYDTPTFRSTPCSRPQVLSLLAFGLEVFSLAHGDYIPWSNHQ